MALRRPACEERRRSRPASGTQRTHITDYRLDARGALLRDFRVDHAAQPVVEAARARMAEKGGGEALRVTFDEKLLRLARASGCRRTHLS